MSLAERFPAPATVSAAAVPDCRVRLAGQLPLGHAIRDLVCEIASKFVPGVPEPALVTATASSVPGLSICMMRDGTMRAVGRYPEDRGIPYSQWLIMAESFVSDFVRDRPDLAQKYPRLVRDIG